MEKKKEEEERKIRGIRAEKEAWAYINRLRRKKVSIDEIIEVREWKTHF